MDLREKKGFDFMNCSKITNTFEEKQKGNEKQRKEGSEWDSQILNIKNFKGFRSTLQPLGPSL